MRVFVTGIAGFLGAHIAREGIARGWEVAGIDNLLGGDPSNVPPEAAFQQADCVNPESYGHLIENADVVYHCAAAPYEGLSVFSPQVVYQHTTMSTIGVLRAAINAKAKRFVFCSSMSRYGDRTAPFFEMQDVRPVDPYACAKVASEQAVQTLCSLHGMEWVIAVPHNIYGPLQRYWDPFRNVAGIMINRILLGRPPVIYGDGSQVRCLSYIDDVTDPLMRLAVDDVAGQVFNVGPDEDEAITISGLAWKIRGLLGLAAGELEPLYIAARPAEVHHATCSSRKARHLLGYSPKWSLEEGLTAYIDWIKQRGPREFEYHLPIEIETDKTPRTWTERLMLCATVQFICGWRRISARRKCGDALSLRPVPWT